MLFNSLTFVVFFVLVLALHRMPFGWVVKKFNLLLASYVFYAAWNPPFVLLLWFSTVLDWWAANAIARSENLRRRKALLMVSVLSNLGLLAYFKYGGFVLSNFSLGMQALGLDYQAPVWNIVLPVGISFYTFQTMSYTLDVYLGRAKPANSFLDFALFVTFFPQLVAGPIVRPTDLLPQFVRERVATIEQLCWGFMLMLLGLFEKIVLADGVFAPVSERVFGAATLVHPLDAWLGTMAFSGQIFCDFAGYTTCAIGASLMLGFALPDNFKFPYAAIGFSDFWRRWHISLSTWLRDYLYVPLGGNRHGEVRTYINLMLTMLLGGLWHGAAWTFVVWGGLHGIYLVLERGLRARFGELAVWRTALGQVSLMLLTYSLVCITWVFFRATDFASAWRMLQAMLGLDRSGAAVLSSYLVLSALVGVGGLLSTHWYMRDRELHQLAARTPAWLLGIALGSMLLLILITQGEGSAFIYFQF
jgi:alginate O-acetyltransferase complex protein AlgI